MPDKKKEPRTETGNQPAAAESRGRTERSTGARKRPVPTPVIAKRLREKAASGPGVRAVPVRRERSDPARRDSPSAAPPEAPSEAASDDGPPGATRRAKAGYRLPWAGQFSLGQLKAGGLEKCLEFVRSAEVIADPKGRRAAIEEAIRVEWFAESAKKRAADPEDQRQMQLENAANVLRGMAYYRLIDRTFALSELGQAIIDEPDETKRAGIFAADILRANQGLELLDAVRFLQSRHEKLTPKAVREELRRRGYTLTVNTADHTKLRDWLSLSGVISSDWEVDEDRVSDLIGMKPTDVTAWQTLTRAQQAFLTTLYRISAAKGRMPVSSITLIQSVRDEHGPVFNEAQVAKQVYEPLTKAGFMTHSVKTGGRGGKGGFITATERLMSLDLAVLRALRFDSVPAEVKAQLGRPLVEIYAEIEGKDKQKAGIALEVLMLHVAGDLGLTPVQMRLRNLKSGSGEVDLLAEGAHLHFSRWLFQCKRTQTVGVEVLAREIGMATILRAHVIVIATTGRFSNLVSVYAQRVTETTQFQVVLINGALLKKYKDGSPQVLRDHFRAEAAQTMRCKRPQVGEALQDLSAEEE
jgi:hypothetical protein